jgi:predicted acyl esterase
MKGKGSAMSTRIILEKNVEIPLRDGTVTRATVYRPEAGAPVSAIPEDLQPAVQTVFHDGARPSHLSLPVSPR